MGDLASQIRLVALLAEYEAAERLAGFFPQVRELGQQADRLHDQLLRVALACGFEPGRSHAHQTTHQWATQRAETLARVFPTHLKAVAQDNRSAA